MYIPPVFAQKDLATLHDFIDQHSFGLLVSTTEGGPVASHLPFLLDRSVGPSGGLLGHMAAANAQWRHAEGSNVLVVFSGPHAYVSPSWYEAENVVPTWNYLAVHVYGTFEVVREPAALASVLAQSVAKYEGPRERPWQFDASGEYARKMMKQIVGFRIEVRQLEGKWKLSQNQPAERRARVREALREVDPAVARWMEE
jgi:transcriptional regulator